jgi:hypothetical protein
MPHISYICRTERGESKYSKGVIDLAGLHKGPGSDNGVHLLVPLYIPRSTNMTPRGVVM